ncbi:hypothetical protein BCR42DRAFT_409553 [Absidia repens]|uniref:L domain-like protein n=1 Tax=Absidia repens TaxID=90262 RepID=A0A1X2IMR0_9FUNG|nr:hypothetical protein BCR42DRAFT_409553 [Absidia repens]
MGQRGSKHHSPLTFGYVNHSESPPPLPPKDGVDTNDALTSSLTTQQMPPDYVLNHPELYKLELMCQCTSKLTMTSKDNNSSSNEEWIVATQQQECRTCRQNKRMSLVRNHLAKDLEYIDETYYAGVSHYESASNVHSTDTTMTPTEQQVHQASSATGNFGANNDDMDDGHEDDDDHMNENWAKITVGEVASQSSRNASGSGVDGQGDISSSIGARMASAQSASFSLDLSERSLVKLSSGIGYLNNLTKLNLSNNQLSSLPKSIGYLNNLSVLNTSHNQLETLPDTLIYLTKLKAINVSHNAITHLTPSLGSLPELIIIIANDNQIKWVPTEIANLQHMISFNISNNPLPHLPAEISSIKSLRKLIADGCDFRTEFTHKREHDPPSLYEQCARTVVSHQLDLPEQLPDHIRSYLATHQQCSFCHGPYFESFVTRGRFIERVARQPIALEYRLCCAHWNDDKDRLLNLFSSSVTTAPLIGKNAGSSLSSGNGVMTDGTNNMSTYGTRKRSASSSSDLVSSSSSYRLLPTLPPLPSLESCSGSSAGSTLPTPGPSSSTSFSSSSSSSSRLPSPAPTPTTSSTLRPPTANRARSHSSTSITKRIAQFMTTSKSSNDLMTRSRSHSSLRQEVMVPSSLSSATSPSTTSPLQQESSTSFGITTRHHSGDNERRLPLSPVDSAYHEHHHHHQQQQQRHNEPSSVDQQNPSAAHGRHRLTPPNRSGVLPALPTDNDDPSPTSTLLGNRLHHHHQDTGAHDQQHNDGSGTTATIAKMAGHHSYLMSNSQSTPLKATVA